MLVSLSFMVAVRSFRNNIFVVVTLRVRHNHLPFFVSHRHLQRPVSSPTSFELSLIALKRGRIKITNPVQCDNKKIYLAVRDL